MADHSIKSKTVLIAGGAKNLGGLLVRDLAQQGAAAVAIHYNSAASKADADRTIAAVQAAGAKAVALQADLTIELDVFPPYAGKDIARNLSVFG